MSKKLYNIKYFKNIMIVIAIIWSAITVYFFIYQIRNENSHLKRNTIKQVKTLSDSSKSLLYWAYRQKVKSKNNKNSNVSTIQNGVGFSIRDMLNNLVKDKKTFLDVGLSYDEDDLGELSPDVQNIIRYIQKRAKDKYMIYRSNGKENIYYMTPLVANQDCISCHIHSDNKIGDVIGYISITKPIPLFYNENSDRYYFLIFSYSVTWLLGMFGIWWFYKEGVRFLDNKVRNLEKSVFSLVDTIEMRDSYTAGHGRRVAQYSKLIAEKLWCSKDDIDLIYKAGILHDIGKIEIPDALLLKPDKLTEEEYALIKRHPEVGYKLLNKEPFKDLSKIVLHHHENYDGTGYPKGLKGKEIPFLSRIIAVADVFDALTTNRIYRPAMSVEEAIDIIMKEKGKKFDPKVLYVAKDVLSSQTIPKEIDQLPHNMIEELKYSYYLKDQVTGAYNINYLLLIINHKYKYNDFHIFSIDFLNFSQYNKTHGWKQGDMILKNIAQKLHDNFKEAKIVRVHGDNFLIVCKKMRSDVCMKIEAIFRDPIFNIRCKETVIKKGDKISIEDLEFL